MHVLIIWFKSGLIILVYKWEPLHAHASILPTKPGKRTAGGRLMFHLPSKLGTVQLGIASYRGFLDGRWNISRPPPVRLPNFVGRIDACECSGSQAFFPRPQESLGTRLIPMHALCDNLWSLKPYLHIANRLN